MINEPLNQSISNISQNNHPGFSNKNLNRFKDCLKTVRHKLNDKKQLILTSDPNFNYSILAVSPLFVIRSNNLEYIDNFKTEDKTYFTDVTRSLFFA